MTYSIRAFAVAAALLTIASVATVDAQTKESVRLVSDSSGFHFDGMPLQIISGEIHDAGWQMARSIGSRAGTAAVNARRTHHGGAS